MVQTRAGRGPREQNAVDIAPSARPTRRRAGADTTTTARRAQATTTAAAGARSPPTRGKGKEKVVPSSITEEEMEEEGEDEDVLEGEEEEEEEEDEDEVRNEPPARFNARHVFKGSMSPPPSESEMGSQSVAGTQRYMTLGFTNAGYTRHSSIARPPDSAARGTDGGEMQLRGLKTHGRGTDRAIDPVRLPGIEDDGVDDPSEIGDVTRLSQEEIDESQYREEAELKENALDSLWHNSEGLAKLLRDPKPKKKSWHRLLDVLRRNWFGTRVFFATEDELFIDLPRTVRHISEESQIKARAVIVGANATALLDALSEVVLDRQHDYLTGVFDHLDEDFPAPFCPDDNWDENIAEEDVELALDIRTHRLIMRLKNLEDERQSPVDVASDIFCDVQALVDAEEALHNGPYKGIEGHETERFGERARTILQLINEKSVAEALRVLDDRFPLEGPVNGIQKHPDVADDFVTKISAWCGRIIDEIGQGLRASPLLPPPRESSPTDSLASSAAQDIVRKDVHEDILSRSNVHLLARLSRQKQPSQATRSSPATTDPRRGNTREPTVNGGFDEDEDQGRREPSLAPTDIEGILADLPSTAITRNSIQPSAAEAGPSGGDVPAPALVVRSSFTPVNGAKRTHSQSQDADDGFEHDDREPDPQRRAQLDRDRRNMPPPPSRPQKRVRLPSTAPLPSSSAHGADLPPNGSASLPPPSSSSSSRGSLPSSTNSSIASFRELSEMNRRAASRGPQQRVPWSERDTRRLIRLIEYHNCLWARIAKRQLPEHRLGEPGPEATEDCIFDHPRDQQAIRDKARNLKVDMLKADLNLYPGFDGVALGKKERQTLISRGKNPDRKEADVDEDGAPTHTEYVPLDDDDEVEGEGEEAPGY
ncbi:Myb DNA-binding domain protein [Colletotrichum tofieldiae]|uniref:Myb DNA-binding domain protein n=1 Tax=Colletotrichum tofieldiae TaxID=708197 RepID=A0A166MBW4_9PEZI|nr:Myb DNA-binding domain protein [Colletotrichum tofieldiae]